MLEILVAFSIMAVALTIVLRIFGSGVHAAVVSEEYSLAVQIAESLMARTGVETPLQAGETSGVEPDVADGGGKYRWQVRISPVITSQPATSQFKSEQEQEDKDAPAAAQLWAISVRVAWGDEDNAQSRSLVLNNLKLAREQGADL